MKHNSMYILSKLLTFQNKKLLETIAMDKFSNESDRVAFISKYYKKGFVSIQCEKKDQTEKQIKKYQRVMR